MLPGFISTPKSTTPAKSPLLPSPKMSRRRTMHGGTAWASSAPGENRLYQPQDGAVEPRGRVLGLAARLLKFSAGEPEDARLTGGTRSLMRRLSGLNLGQLMHPKAPKSVSKTQLPPAKVA